MHLSRLIAGLLALGAFAAATPAVLAQNTIANTPVNADGEEALAPPTPAAVRFHGHVVFTLRTSYGEVSPQKRVGLVETDLERAFEAGATAKAETGAGGQWRVMAGSVPVSYTHLTLPTN